MKPWWLDSHLTMLLPQIYVQHCLYSCLYSSLLVVSYQCLQILEDLWSIESLILIDDRAIWLARVAGSNFMDNCHGNFWKNTSSGSSLTESWVGGLKSGWRNTLYCTPLLRGFKSTLGHNQVHTRAAGSVGRSRISSPAIGFDIWLTDSMFSPLHRSAWP